MEFTKQQLIGLFGSLLLLIGVFLPVLSVPIMGSISLLNNGRSDGMIIFGLAIASSVLIFIRIAVKPRDLSRGYKAAIR